VNGDAPDGFSLDASVNEMDEAGFPLHFGGGLPDSRDLMHGRTGGSLRIGLLRRKIPGTGRNAKAEGPRNNKDAST